MANYAVDPDMLSPYLPKGVELDFFQDKCYVSLVGFMFRQTRLFKVPILLLGTFEEINLRFYVKRVEGNNIKRGVVFVNETVPYKVVAWLANKLYKEHYISIPTKNKLRSVAPVKSISYQWKIKAQWNHLMVDAGMERKEMLAGSMEEFIFEHYYGYTKINQSTSQEYKVDHPRWHINQVIDYSIVCDFEVMYGSHFSVLTHQTPDSVFLAEGSPITVAWKRQTF